MRMERLALCLLLLFFFSGIGAAAETGESSEPDFLHDIGPQTERQDNWVAAAVVAVGVSFVILRGLWIDRRDS